MSLDRRGNYMLNLPIKLPANVDHVEVDSNPAGAAGSQVVFTIFYNDGTATAVVKGNIPTLAVTGFTVTLT
jgi:hypothetical protein